MRPTTQGLHKVGWGSQQAPSPFLGMHVLWSRTSCWQRVYQQLLCSPKEPLLLLLDRTIQRLTKFAGKEIVSACPRVDSCPTQATFRPIFRKRLFTPCESCSSVKLQWARHRARRPFLISQTVIGVGWAHHLYPYPFRLEGYFVTPLLRGRTRILHNKNEISHLWGWVDLVGMKPRVAMTMTVPSPHHPSCSSLPASRRRRTCLLTNSKWFGVGGEPHRMPSACWQCQLGSILPTGSDVSYCLAIFCYFATSSGTWGKLHKI